MAPSARGGGGSGIVYFDPSLTRYVGWFIALPSAKVEGTLTYNGHCTMYMEKDIMTTTGER
jgi:hypothetical protein